MQLLISFHFFYFRLLVRHEPGLTSFPGPSFSNMSMSSHRCLHLRLLSSHQYEIGTGWSTVASYPRPLIVKRWAKLRGGTFSLERGIEIRNCRQTVKVKNATVFYLLLWSDWLLGCLLLTALPYCDWNTKLKKHENRLLQIIQLTIIMMTLSKPYKLFVIKIRSFSIRVDSGRMLLWYGLVFF